MSNRENRQEIVTIDGINYNIMIPENGIERSFSIADTDNAGRLLNGTMVRDIIGTYYNYKILFETKYLSTDEYDNLYAKLSAPVDYHMITVPYGQETLTFQAYITSGSDTLRKVRGNKNDWTGLSVDFIAISPQRTPLTS